MTENQIKHLFAINYIIKITYSYKLSAFEKLNEIIQLITYNFVEEKDREFMLIYLEDYTGINFIEN